MSILNRWATGSAGLLLAAGGLAVAADQTIQIDFPPESPVAVVSADMGSSTTTPRGGALVVDLHTSLRLRNVSQNQIRGVTLLVLAQEVTPGGKASVSVPSLNAGPGEIFPVRVDLRLLRPLQAAGGPLVRVDLDGVLFDDLSFYGPNRLNSRRSMMVWELQARRDRDYLRRVLAAKGAEGLRDEILASLARQAERPRLNVQVARLGRATNIDSGRYVEFAFLRFPGSPVEPLSGSVRLVEREAQAPEIEVLNRSDRPVRHLEVGWILRDRQGQEYLAGTVPAEVDLAPGRSSQIATQTVLRFPAGLAVESMAGFLSHVEFADGGVWIPSREEIGGQGLSRLVAPSPEEQRLTNIYRKKGLEALVGELGKF